MLACVCLIATVASVQAQTLVEPLSPQQGFSQQPWEGQGLGTGSFGSPYYERIQDRQTQGFGGRDRDNRAFGTTPDRRSGDSDEWQGTVPQPYYGQGMGNQGYVPRDYERQRGREWLGGGDADEFNQGVMPYGGWGGDEQPYYDQGFGSQGGFDQQNFGQGDFDRGFGTQQGFDQQNFGQGDFDRGFGTQQGFGRQNFGRGDFDRGSGVQPYDDRPGSFRQNQPGVGEQFGDEGFRNGGTDAFGVPFNQPGFGRGGEQFERPGGGQFQQQSPGADAERGQMGGGRVGGQMGAGSSGGRSGGGRATSGGAGGGAGGAGGGGGR